MEPSPAVMHRGCKAGSRCCPARVPETAGVADCPAAAALGPPRCHRTLRYLQCCKGLQQVRQSERMSAQYHCRRVSDTQGSRGHDDAATGEGH